VRIAARFNGPPTTGNGGVSCGLLAEYVDAPVVEVTLRRPPPLETELRVDDGELYDEDLLVASAAAGSVDVEVPAPVTLDEARAAADRYEGWAAHPFPTCFSCGTDREPPDGLGLRPARVGDGVVAAVWTPESDERFLVWAALDCPGGWAVPDLPGRPMVLGRMALEHLGAPVVGEAHVVLGWVLGTDGRKTFSGTALYDAAGTLLARAHQTWFALPPSPS
jgi:hypothetical protein